MLTGHQAVLIRRHLPEVVSVNAVVDREIAGIYYRQLWLADGTQIVLFGEDAPRARRYRGRDDYSDRTDLVPIEPDLRGRLAMVFGPLTFGESE